MIRASVVTCLVLSCLSALAVAQTAPPAPGDRIRVEARRHEGRPVGHLLAFDSERLSLRPEGRTDSMVVYRSDLLALERSAGRHSRGHGAAIGAGIGIGAGVIAGFAAGDDPSSGDLSLTAGDKAIVLGLGLGVIGMIVGLCVRPGEIWKKVPLEPAVVGSRVGDPASGVALTLRF